MRPQPAVWTQFAVVLVAVHSQAAVCRFVSGGIPPHLAPEDLTAAVRFEEDRTAGQLLARARESLRVGRHAEAVSLLQELLDSHRAGLIASPTGYHSGLHQVHELLRSAAPAVIVHYERHSGKVASTELELAVRQPGEQALIELVQRFRFTEAGTTALETLAQRHFDAADFAGAAMLYSELIRGAPDARQMAAGHPAAVRAWILALAHGGQLRSAHAVATEFAGELRSLPDVVLERLVEQLREQSRLAALPARVASDAHLETHPLLPSSRAEWEVLFDPPDNGIAEFDAQLLQQFGAGSIAPYLHGRPLETPAGLVIRTRRRIVCRDAATGDVHWRWPDGNPSLDPIPTPSGIAQSLEHFRELELETGDSVHAGLVTDGRRIYFLDAGDDSALSDELVSNAVAAIDATSGDSLWTRGGIDRMTTGSDSLEDVFFRGTPTVHGSEILVVGDRGGVTALFALDAATGALNWTVKLCSIDGNLLRDDRRLAQECRVLIVSGQAVCPTGGGAVVGVDLLGHDVRWAYRYPREPVREDDLGRQSQANPHRQLLWADSWSAPFLDHVGRRIVLASSESDHLHALDAGSGLVLWTIPRGDAAFVACLTESHAILVHPRSVTAIRLVDGHVDWTTAVEQPAGQGCVAAGHYLLPLIRGDVAAVRLEDGRVSRTWSPDHALPHLATEANAVTPWRPVTFAFVNGCVFEQSLHAVRRLKSLTDALESAELAYAQQPDDARAAATFATHLREAGAFERAADILLTQIAEDDETSEREHLLRSTLDTMFTGSWLARDASRLVNRALPLTANDADRVRFHVCRLREALNQHSPSTIDGTLTLLDLEAERYFLEREDGTGWVRLDRQLQSWLQQLFDEVDGPKRELLRTSFTDALQQRLTQTGDTGAHRVLSLLSHLPAAQRLRVDLPPRWSTIDELIAYELELSLLAEHDDRAIAASALLALAHLYEARSDYLQAARTWRRLKSLAPGELLSGESIDDVLSGIPADSPVRPSLDNPALPEWPAREPEITSRPGQHDDTIYFTEPQTVAESPGLVDGITISVARNGNRLCFTGGLWSQQWYLDLPPTRGFGEIMRNEVFADQRRIWTFGSLLLVQIGGNLFAAAPLDRNGEASAELLWPDGHSLISAGERVAKIYTNPDSEAPRLSGFPERRLLLDRYLQPVGLVGPVRRGYCCVRQAGELTAFETATGVRLWTLSGLPPAVQCYGDDQHLVLIRSDDSTISVLRALDGALLSSYEWSQHDSELLSCFGCRALTLREKPAGPPGTNESHELILSVCDLTDGELLWSQILPTGSICFPGDTSCCGVLEPDGTVRLIELETGDTRAEHQIERPQQVTGIRTILDRQALFLTLSEPVDDPAIQATIRTDGTSPNTGFRKSEVNGSIHAFERDSGQLLWSREIDNAVIALDQARDVPILVFKELRTAGPGSSLLQNRMRVLDKRTGSILLDETSDSPISRHVIERSRLDGWVEIRCPDRTYRFDYTDRAEVDKTP